MISSMFCSSVGPADFTVVDESAPPEHCTFCFPPAYPRRSHSSIQFITVKPLMFACPLFREPNKTAKLKGANINCSVRENVCNNSKIRKKSYFLDFSKKTSKNVRIMFHGCLMFIVPLHCCQNLTPFPLDIQQWLRMDHTRGSDN